MRLCLERLAALEPLLTAGREQSDEVVDELWAARWEQPL